MKKPIRFNLQFQNGKESVQIRNLDDLEENMNINDLLDSFLSCDLERWLRQRNEIKRADAISKLEHNDDEETLLKLFEALDVGFSEAETKDIIGRYTHQKTMAQGHVEMQGKTCDTTSHANSDFNRDAKPVLGIQNNSLQISSFNENRFEQYKQLKERIKYMPKNSSFSSHKNLIDELLNDYSDYFELDWFSFFFEMLPKKGDYCYGGLMAIFILWSYSQWHLYFSLLIEYSTQYSKSFDLKDLIDYKSEKDHSHDLPDSFRRSLLHFTGINGDIEEEGPHFRDDFGENSVSSFDFYLNEEGEISLARFFDKLNEMNDDSERPIKLICAASGDWEKNEWITLVPQGKKVFVLYKGWGIELDSDGTKKPDIKIYDGLKFRYRSITSADTEHRMGVPLYGSSQYPEWSTLVFMEAN